jgi:hypothetical protein
VRYPPPLGIRQIAGIGIPFHNPMSYTIPQFPKTSVLGHALTL